jgi:prepilin-type N-terminal cleavage/methylation domain-containing protein
MDKRKYQVKGFTIVELLIVIVVIGILAAITMVTYTGITQRANYAKEQSDISSINKLIQEYYATNESYPNTGGSGSWVGWNEQKDFIPGIVPTYASSIPNITNGTGGDSYNDSYLYTSDGTNYKLIRYSGTAGLPSVERTNNSLADPQRTNGPWGWINGANGAWGYWSDGAANW